MNVLGFAALYPTYQATGAVSVERILFHMPIKAPILDCLGNV